MRTSARKPAEHPQGVPAGACAAGDRAGYAPGNAGGTMFAAGYSAWAAMPFEPAWGELIPSAGTIPRSCHPPSLSELDAT